MCFRKIVITSRLQPARDLLAVTNSRSLVGLKPSS